MPLVQQCYIEIWFNDSVLQTRDMFRVTTLYLDMFLFVHLLLVQAYKVHVHVRKIYMYLCQNVAGVTFLVVFGFNNVAPKQWHFT